MAALIDRHLASIYPVFTQTTRAVLIREARDVLVNIYHGCLATFEQQFLCKFAEIAVILKQRHRVGEVSSVDCCPKDLQSFYDFPYRTINLMKTFFFFKLKGFLKTGFL